MHLASEIVMVEYWKIFSHFVRCYLQLSTWSTACHVKKLIKDRIGSKVALLWFILSAFIGRSHVQSSIFGLNSAKTTYIFMFNRFCWYLDSQFGFYSCHDSQLPNWLRVVPCWSCLYLPVYCTYNHDNC